MSIGSGTNFVNFLRETTLGVTVTLVLLCLLTQKELLDAHGGRRAQRVAQLTAIVSAPILLLFVAVITVRFLHLLHML
jgi:hypothetical protein